MSAEAEQTICRGGIRNNQLAQCQGNLGQGSYEGRGEHKVLGQKPGVQESNQGEEGSLAKSWTVASAWNTEVGAKRLGRDEQEQDSGRRPTPEPQLWPLHPCLFIWLWQG